MSNYMDFENEYENPKQPIGIAIAKRPNKTAYRSGEMFDARGMTMQLLYPDGTRTYTTAFSCYPDGALTSENTFIEVRSAGFVARVRITVDSKIDCNCSSADECYHDCCNGHAHSDYYYYGDPYTDPSLPWGITIEKEPNKTTYYEGEYFDPTGMEVAVYYYRFSNHQIITGYTILNNEPLTADCNEVEVIYGQFSAKVNIKVIPRVYKDELPAAKRFDFAGVTGRLKLGTGKTDFAFNDLGIDGVLPLKISHVYNKCETDFECGNNWRLNLHQTLIKHDSRDELGYNQAQETIPSEYVEYIYTDANGDRHGFDEVFYYINENGEKAVVKKKMSILN